MMKKFFEKIAFSIFETTKLLKMTMNKMISTKFVKWLRRGFFLGGIFLFVCCFVASWWFLIPTLVSLGFYVVYLISMLHLNRFLNGSRIKTFEGGPRAGKTDAATTVAVVQAERSYAYVKSYLKKEWKRFQRTIQFIDKYQYCSDLDEAFICHYIELQKTRAFYMHNPKLIPCLFSNVPIEYKGGYAAHLQYEHTTLEKALPYGAVLLVDEAQSVFPVDSYKHRDKAEELRDLVNMFERIGHYIDGYLIQTAQDADNETKDIRRLSPSITKLKNVGMKFMRYLGLRLFDAKETDRMQENEVVQRTAEDDGFRKLLLPCMIGRYNDRHLMKLYPCKEDILNASSPDGLILEDSEENRKLYSREIVKKNVEKRRR